MSPTYQALLDKLKSLADNLGLWQYGIPTGGFTSGSLVSLEGSHIVTIVGLVNLHSNANTTCFGNPGFRYVPSDIIWEAYHNAP